VTHP